MRGAGLRSIAHGRSQVMSISSWSPMTEIVRSGGVKLTQGNWFCFEADPRG